MFHSLQFTAQAWQPTQVSRSMTRPSFLPRRWRGQAGHVPRPSHPSEARRRTAGSSAPLAQHVGRLGMLGGSQRREARRAACSQRRLLDPDAEVVPRRLAGDRVGVGVAVAALVSRQQFGDQVVEQEALASPSGASLRRSRRRARLPIAFQVQTVSGLTPSISCGPGTLMRPCWLVTQTQSPSAMPELLGRRAVHVEAVLRDDLAQPGVLRSPGVIHGHRPLGDRMQREVLGRRSAAASNGGYQNGSGSK